MGYYNDLVEKALEIGATNLIMLDVDMVYHVKTIPALLSRKKPVVGAMSFRRYPPFDPIMLRLTEQGYGHVDKWEPDELVEVDATGAGCIMFDMQIFRTMPYPWFRFQKNADTGAVIGEDVGFCQDLKAAGYKIYVDTSVPSDHLTTMRVSERTYRLYKSMKYLEHKRSLERALGAPNGTIPAFIEKDGYN